MSPAVIELPSGLCWQSAGRDSYRRGRLPEYSLRWIMSCFLAVFLSVIETRTGRDPTGQRAPFPQPKLVPNLLSSRYLLGKFGREGFSGNPTQSRPGLTVPPVTCWVFVVFFFAFPTAASAPALHCPSAGRAAACGCVTAASPGSRWRRSCGVGGETFLGGGMQESYPAKQTC